MLHLTATASQASIVADYIAKEGFAAFWYRSGRRTVVLTDAPCEITRAALAFAALGGDHD